MDGRSLKKIGDLPACFLQLLVNQLDIKTILEGGMWQMGEKIIAGDPNLLG